MPLEDVLLHTAVPVRTVETSVMIEGEQPLDEEQGTPFDCVLFLPLGTEEDTPRSGRNVRRPTLLYQGMDRLGGRVRLSPKDELLITAPELNTVEGLDADAQIRWQVNGSPQPFGRPGDQPVGLQANLLRVDD